MNNEKALLSTIYLTKIPYLLKKKILSLPLWCAAETKILAGLSWVMWPAELIEMAQYSPFTMAGVFLVFFLVKSLYNYLVDGDSDKF